MRRPLSFRASTSRLTVTASWDDVGDALMLALRVSIVAGTLLAAWVPASAVRTQNLIRVLPLAVEAPRDNPTTPEKVALGRLLFWDPILSGPQDRACATCHRPQLAYTDGRDLAIGAEPHGTGPARPSSGTRHFVRRNSMSVVNAGFNGITVLDSYAPAAAPMFWDSRVFGLEAQALEPLKARDEMRGDSYLEADAIETVVERVAKIEAYRAAFARAFGGPTPVTAMNLGRAIAAFERSLLANNSPFDRYMRGERGAMSAAQVRGMYGFEHFGCSLCHKGPMFSDYTVHVLGIPDNPKLNGLDTGFGRMYAFRTPSLRNVALTAPYMHNGVFASLEDVLEFYDQIRLGASPRFRHPNVSNDMLDPLIERIGGGGGSDVLAFLDALTDSSFDRTIPAGVPSGLPPGGLLK
jgi:cytochrome c peroxidase